jgi:hypothetical protein
MNPPMMKSTGLAAQYKTLEYLLEPDSYKKDPVIEVPIVPRRSGELFLYVNEGVLPWPLPRDFFYRDNKGTATVEVRNVK